MTNIKYKYRKVHIVVMEKGKEAKYHIEILPKNLNFKKITKNHKFHVFLLEHALTSRLFYKKNTKNWHTPCSDICPATELLLTPRLI